MAYVASAEGVNGLEAIGLRTPKATHIEWSTNVEGTGIELRLIVVVPAIS